MTTSPSSLLTPADVAARLRVCLTTVYTNIFSGRLAAYRVGRQFRIPEQALLDYLQAGRETRSREPSGEADQSALIQPTTRTRDDISRALNNLAKPTKRTR